MTDGADGNDSDAAGMARVLFTNSSDAIVLARYEGDEPIVQEVNPTFAETFGVSQEEAAGNHIDDLVGANEVRDDSDPEEINRRVKAGKQLENVVERRTAEGTRMFRLRSVPLDEDEGPERAFAIYSDVTDRRDYEQTLENLHDATRRLFQSESHDEACQTAVEIGKEVLGQPYVSVFSYDSETDRISLEIHTEEAARDLGPPPTFEPGEGIVGHVFESGEAVITDDAANHPLSHDQGTQEIHGYSAFPLGEHGVLVFCSDAVGAPNESDLELANILAAATEVTLDRVARERSLRQREQDLERQNQRLERFASVVSHDLRNPLNVASGRLELAMDECDSDHLDPAAQSLERMADLIDGLLSLARQGRRIDETEPVDLGDLARSAWTTVQTAGATLSVAGDVDEVVCDPDRTRQLLENLFRNAVDHAGEDVAVELGGLECGGFYIADDGPGIPPERREEIFEMGVSDTGGSGFGLAIVEEIAEAHGWRVEVTDSAQGGARFEFHTGG